MLCDGLNVRGRGQSETPQGSEESNLEAAVTAQSQSRRERKRKDEQIQRRTVKQKQRKAERSAKTAGLCV